MEQKLTGTAQIGAMITGRFDVASGGTLQGQHAALEERQEQDGRRRRAGEGCWEKTRGARPCGGSAALLAWLCVED